MILFGELPNCQFGQLILIALSLFRSEKIINLHGSSILNNILLNEL